MSILTVFTTFLSGRTRTESTPWCSAEAMFSSNRVATRECIRNGATELLKSCPNQIQAIEWYELCTLRYSNEMIFGTLETTPAYWLSNPNNATSPEKFKEDLRTLIDSLLGVAAHGGSLRKVAAGNVTGPDSQTIFVLVQCTPDLSSDDCSSCLSGAAADIHKCYDWKIGGRVLQPSCYVHFETQPLYDETRLQKLAPVRSPAPAPEPEPKPEPPGNGDGNKTQTIIIIVASIVAFVILVASIGILLRKRMKQKPKLVNPRTILAHPNLFNMLLAQLRLQQMIFLIIKSSGMVDLELFTREGFQMVKK